LLIYGPSKPIVDNGFSDQFALHCFETIADLDVDASGGGENPRAAVTYTRWAGDVKNAVAISETRDRLVVRVGYDHIVQLRP